MASEAIPKYFKSFISFIVCFTPIELVDDNYDLDHPFIVNNDGTKEQIMFPIIYWRC